MITRLLALRTCAADGTSRNGRRWPLVTGAVIEAPDWDQDPRRDIGGGLHGLPWGHGAQWRLNFDHDAWWLVVEVDIAAGCVGLSDAIYSSRVRFRRGTVRYAGDRYGAVAYLHREGARGAYAGAVLAGGNYAQLHGGVHAQLTAGDYATLVGGHYATLAGGDYSKLTGGNHSTLTAKLKAVITGGDYATLTGGAYATLTGGAGSVFSGSYSAIFVGWWYDRRRGRLGRSLAEVDGQKIMERVKYRVDDATGEWVRA